MTVKEIGLEEAIETWQVDEFETLVNPHRDVGPTWLHQISSSMVRDAPDFGEIAGLVATRLDGAVACAHNLPFQHRMIMCSRCGDSWMAKRRSATPVCDSCKGT